jgi:hypothetical protein
VIPRSYGMTLPTLTFTSFSREEKSEKSWSNGVLEYWSNG